MTFEIWNGILWNLENRMEYYEILNMRQNVMQFKKWNGLLWNLENQYNGY